ncbi:MAG TPA: Xaa-Pro peptidase family protein [Candidatus Omnitrophota bacterium]|nr:Xaa-Pro peptidase family protein [Candidatus Omnitrophota bacterium]HRZ14853.1 Xaa-Pro peptidase family protein [Candidatus Omnitrophota bacterium]
MNKRIQQVLASLKKQKIDAAFFSSAPAVSYLTGYKSRDSYLLVSRQQQLYMTDSRYTAEARQHLKGFTVEQVRESGLSSLALTCARLKFKTLGFENRSLSYADYQRMKEKLPPDLVVTGISGVVEQLRQIKSPAELRIIRQATRITLEAYSYIKQFIRPGIREIELAGELERFIRYHGAACASFDIIVASGPNSSFPHHLTSARRVEADEPVMIDMGVEVDGYKSDLTRVFFSGKIKTLANRLYSVVLTAQQKAIARVKPGVALQDIDQAARHYLDSRGVGKYFLHSLGHGVGLEVHEQPYVNCRARGVLKPGMVFTVEPAVYLPGKFGIRIEDMVVVTRKGCEVISGSVN